MFHKLKFIRYSKLWNDFKLGYYTIDSNKCCWTDSAYSYEQLKGHISRAALVQSMNKINRASGIVVTAPGDDVWDSMKCYHVHIEFQQERTLNCLTYSLASALFKLGDRHICHALVDIAEYLNKLNWKDQVFKIKEVYNKVFCENPIYGLGQASVITKNKKLKPILDNLHKPAGKLLTILVGDHSVSLYGLFIFNSQNTHAVYRSKENLNYIFGADFKLTPAITFQHNADTLK